MNERCKNEMSPKLRTKDREICHELERTTRHKTRDNIFLYLDTLLIIFLNIGKTQDQIVMNHSWERLHYQLSRVSVESLHAMTWQSHNKCPPSWENINALLVMLTWVDPIMLMGCSHHRIQTILAAPTSMFLRSLWTVEQNIYDIWHCKQLQTRGTWTLKDLPLLCINIIFKLKREHVCIIYALNHSRVLINLKILHESVKFEILLPSL